MSIERHRSPDLLATTTAERRSAPRLLQADVPWLRAIRPNISGSARLVNISRTGVLFDTRDRLAPGRRTALLAVADDQRMEKLPAIVVRTYVVSIAENTRVLYRTALEFDHEFPWDLRIPAPAENGVLASSTDLALAHTFGPPDATVPHTSDELMVAGPVEALLSTERGAQLVSVTALTETGCAVRTNEAVKMGGWVSIATFFSGAQGPLLTGRVTSITGDGRCVVRFVDLAAAERDALRKTLRRGKSRNGQPFDPKTLTADGQLLTGVPFGVQMPGQTITAHASQW